SEDRKMGPNRWIHLMFIGAVVVLAFLLAKSGGWAVGYFVAKPPENLIAVASVVVSAMAGLIAYRNYRVLELAAEVAGELRKVSWPTRKETRAATVVVIVTVLVFAVILGLYDAFWSWMTTRIYS